MVMGLLCVAVILPRILNERIYTIYPIDNEFGFRNIKNSIFGIFMQNLGDLADPTFVINDHGASV